MAIIRSKIARQLLADGGVSLDDAKMMAPQGEFLAYINPKEAGVLKSMGGSGRMTPMGIPSFTEDERDQDYMNEPSVDYSSQDLEEQAAIDAGEPTAQMSTYARDMQGFGPGTNINDLDSPTFFQNVGAGLSNLIGQGRRGENIMNFLNRSTAQTLRGQLGLGRRGDINYVLEQLQANKGDPVAMGLSNKQFEIGQKLIDAGIVDETDIRNMTQSKFDELFPGPQTGEGGDNEPIKKLRAPITEKKEEESKGEFDDILQFYGAKFAKGGSTGFEGSPEMGGRGTTETYGFDQSGPAGNSGDGGGPPAGPPTFTGGGEPEYVYAGIGKGKGLTPQEISILNADIFNEYYGTPSRQEEVLGPLGTAPSGLMGAGAATFGQVPGGLLGAGKGTTGTTGTTGTGFTVNNIADTIFDKGSLGGNARDALRSSKSNVQSLRDRFDIPEKADGGAIRQNYGLGSIVKKAVGAVKKVAKFYIKIKHLINSS